MHSDSQIIMHSHSHSHTHQKLVRDRQGESAGSCIKLDSFRAPWPALTLVKCGFKASRHIVHAHKCTKHTHIKCSRRQGCNFGLGHRCHLCRSLAPLAAGAGLPWGGLCGLVWSGLAWCGVLWWDLSSAEVGSGVCVCVCWQLSPFGYCH